MNALQQAAALAALSLPGAAQGTELQSELQVIPAPPPPDGSLHYNFWVGGAVAASGSWMAVADHAADKGHGEVYMYHRTSHGWEFVQRLDGGSRKGFGSSVSLDGETLVVGGEVWSAHRGKVFVFGLEAGAWTLTQELVPEDEPAEGPLHFGRTVAVLGNALAVTAFGIDDPVEDAGEVRVYERGPSGWVGTQRLRLPAIPDVMNGEYRALGASLAMSEDRLIAGAFGNKGAVYVYERDATAWRRTAILTNPSPEPGDSFGAAVDIEGDTIVVGRPHLSVIEPRIGSAFVYRAGPSGDWALVQELRASDGYAGGGNGDQFGETVAIERGRIVVGASYARHNGPKTGTLYLFDPIGVGWRATETLRMVASDCSGQYDQLGQSLAVHEGFVVAGAPGGWQDGVRKGKAYVFPLELGDAPCEPPGAHALLSLVGSEVVSDDQLAVVLHGAPPRARALFLLSPSAGSSPFGQTTLCLGAPITRIGYGLTGATGVAIEELALQAPWLASKLHPGSTWFFQAAHERLSGSGQLDLTTNSVSLTMQ